MATTYTGVATATQAPSGPPVPGGAPIAQLPADTDPANAASVAQMAKVAMDWIAWALTPRARASQWAEAILKFKSALLHDRFGIDHLGFPAGKLNAWLETWLTADYVAASSGAGTYVTPGFPGGWSGTIGKGGAGGTLATIAIADPDATIWSASRYVKISVGDTIGDISVLKRTPQAVFFADNCIAMEWDAKLDAVDAIRKAYMGFSVGGAHGAWLYIYYDQATTKWVCTTDDGAASTIYTGPTATTAWTRFRIEWHGANADDGSVKQALFFINGTLVTNITTTLPDGATPAVAQPWFALERIAGGAPTPPWLYLACVRFASNTWLNAF